MSVANDALAAVRKDEISAQGKDRVEFDLHRPRNQLTGAGTQDFGEPIVDFVFLSERDDSILGASCKITGEIGLRLAI